MKAVAFNGSPNKEGNTWRALRIVADELEKEGIETSIVQVGDKVIRGCTACYGCIHSKNEQCVMAEDGVNGWLQEMKQADGILLGSPVHYASMAGTMKSFLDRAFFVAGVNGSMLRHKVGASVVAVRRSGGLPAFDQLNELVGTQDVVLVIKKKKWDSWAERPEHMLKVYEQWMAGQTYYVAISRKDKSLAPLPCDPRRAGVRQP